MRLLVLESSHLKKRAEEALEKERKKLDDLIKALKKKEFHCEADAEEERKRFGRERPLELYECKYEVEKKMIEKWPRGRRGEKTRPMVEESWHIGVSGIERKEGECQEYIRTNFCIVLISNAGSEYEDEDLVRSYKGQQVVENSFRELKSPSMASVICLKNPERVKALAMLLTLSLLIRAIIQYRLREGLKKYEEKAPGEKLRAGWGNRPLKNPTYRLFYEHSVNCYYEKESIFEYSYAWPTVDTRQRVEIQLMLLGESLESLLK